MQREPLSGDEVVYRRIPRAHPWFESDEITRANFDLDSRPPDPELGVSVYRAAIVTPDQVLSKPEAVPKSLIASATVQMIRDAKSGADKALQLDVIAIDDETDPGHAEIRGPTPGEMPQAARKALKKLFRILPSGDYDHR